MSGQYRPPAGRELPIATIAQGGSYADMAGRIPELADIAAALRPPPPPPPGGIVPIQQGSGFVDQTFVGANLGPATGVSSGTTLGPAARIPGDAATAPRPDAPDIQNPSFLNALIQFLNSGASGSGRVRTDYGGGSGAMTPTKKAPY